LLGWLRLRILPEHPWGLINALGLVYLLLIGPAAMILFRKRIRKIRWVLAYLCGTIAVFSLLFLTIGRRGYGEKAGGVDFIYARVLGSQGDRAYLRAWSQVFVTDSGVYDIRFGDGSHQFNIADQGQGMTVEAREGAEASLGIRLPVFSSAGFERESMQSAPGFRAEALGGGRYRVHSGFELQPEGFALVEGRVHPLRRQGNGEWLVAGNGQALEEAWLSNQHRYYQLNNVYGRQAKGRDTQETKMAQQLAAMAGLDLADSQGQPLPPWDEPRARQGTHLFFNANAPENWLFRHPGLRILSATVLLHADLTALENPPHVP